MFALPWRIDGAGITIPLVEQNVSLALANRGYVLENGAVALAG
jgi:ABC-type branched-subunit amino acid transport system ATPase component